MRHLVLITTLGLLLSQTSLASTIIYHGGENEGPRAMASEVKTADTMTYSGWISFDSTINSYTVELQGSQPGVSGDDWAALQFTTADQEAFAREQFSSETRPLLKITGELLQGTGNAYRHQLATLKVTSITEAASSYAADMLDSAAYYDSGVAGNCLEERPRPSPACCQQTHAHIPACGFTGP